MSVKLTILKTGETLISDMQELVSDKEQTTPHAYLLINPHLVKIREKQFLTEEEKNDKKVGIDVLMTPWIILSKDKKIILATDSVVTIVDPIEGIEKMYLDKRKTFKIEEELNG